MTDWNETLDERVAPAAPSSVCICDPQLRALEVFDGLCPEHGLVATLTAAVRRIKENDRS